MNAYYIKIALRGVSPMVWRRFRIPGKTSLAQLHDAIQTAFNWDNEYLHQFHIYGKDYGIYYPGGMNFSDNAHHVFFEDFGFDEADKFTYEYNFFDHWVVDTRIERIQESTKTSSIHCLKGNGMPGVDKYDEVEPTLDLLRAIVNAEDTIIMADILPIVDTLQALRINNPAASGRGMLEECNLPILM